MIDLSDDELEIVISLLTEHVPGSEVLVFGSRINGSTKPYSDLDLVIVSKEKIDSQQLSELREALVESDLPFRVDLLDWTQISAEFKAVIDQKYEEILNYTITSDHIHLIVRNRGGDNEIRRLIQLVAGRTGQEYNARKHRKGAFWEDRYHATAIETGNYLQCCLVYLDLNMVRA